MASASDDRQQQLRGRPVKLQPRHQYMHNSTTQIQPHICGSRKWCCASNSRRYSQQMTSTKCFNPPVASVSREGRRHAPAQTLPSKEHFPVTAEGMQRSVANHYHSSAYTHPLRTSLILTHSLLMSNESRSLHA